MRTARYTASSDAPSCCIASTSCLSFSKYLGVATPRLGIFGTDLTAYLIPVPRCTASRTTPKLPAPMTLPTMYLHGQTLSQRPQSTTFYAIQACSLEMRSRHADGADAQAGCNILHIHAFSKRRPSAANGNTKRMPRIDVSVYCDILIPAANSKRSTSAERHVTHLPWRSRS